MFKFSAYPPASFWDKTKAMLACTSANPAPQEQPPKPADKDKQGKEQGQQVAPSLAGNLA